MGYATIEFYKNTYHGNSIPDDTLQSMLDKASVDIDTLTRMKIKKFGGFDKLSEFEQTQVQMAACFQADYAYAKSSMKGVSSYSIGDVSMSFDISKDYDDKCIMYLNSTHLMYRGL
jgi:hypothetical protein